MPPGKPEFVPPDIAASIERHVNLPPSFYRYHPDAALDGAAIAVEQFQLGQTQQITRIINLLGGALPGHLVVLTEDGGQPQGLEMMFEQNLRYIGSSRCRTAW